MTMKASHKRAQFTMRGQANRESFLIRKIASTRWVTKDATPEYGAAAFKAEVKRFTRDGITVIVRR